MSFLAGDEKIHELITLKLILRLVSSYCHVRRFHAFLQLRIQVNQNRI